MPANAIKAAKSNQICFEYVEDKARRSTGVTFGGRIKNNQTRSDFEYEHVSREEAKTANEENEKGSIKRQAESAVKIGHRAYSSEHGNGMPDGPIGVR